MANVVFTETDLTLIENPEPGTKLLGINLLGVPQLKDSDGNITELTSSGGGAGIDVAVIDLSSNDIKNLHSTPIQILPAAGVNSAYIFYSPAYYIFTFGTIGYSSVSTANIDTTLGSGTFHFTHKSINVYSARSGLVLTANTIIPNTSFLAAGIPFGDFNEPIYLGNSGTALTTGDGTMKVVIPYTKIDY